MQPLLVDTDMAIDDWIALLYLLENKAVDVRAITIAGTGEAHGYWGRQNALRMLTLSSAKPCAVAAGRAKPLRGQHAFPWLVRVIMDLHLGLTLPPASHRAPDPGARALLAEQLRQATVPLTILTLGPLTNLAETLLTEPELAKQIAMIYSMGGALDVPGNLGEITLWPANPYAEWNFYVDPYAVEVVLRSGVPLTLIPLDETNHHPLTTPFYEQLVRTVTSDSGNFIVRLLGRVRRLLGRQTFYFWDPLAAVVATCPEIATFQMRKLSIIADDGPQSGRLIDDPTGHPVRVCVGVDQQAFETLLLKVFCSEVA